MSRLDPEESMTRVPGKRYGLSYVQGKLLLLLPPHVGAAEVKMSSATLLNVSDSTALTHPAAAC